jgi:hypothetical protein
MDCDSNNEAERPLFLFEEEPWSLLPKNSHVRKKKEYILEIKRRARLFNIAPERRPNKWTRVQILEWLKHNPIRNVADDV